MGPTIVESALPITLIDTEGQPHEGGSVRLTWCASDPFEVCLSIEAANGVVNWNISRELLCSSLAGPAGIGDVRISPCYGYGESGGDEIEIRLFCPPDNLSCVRLIFSHSDVLDFLLDTDQEYREAERRFIEFVGDMIDAGWPWLG